MIELSLETPRLVLRRWRDDDMTPMTAIGADPEVMRWIGNDAPERVMQKLGMRLDRETIDPSCDRPIRVYAITRDEYHRTNSWTPEYFSSCPRSDLG